MRIILHTFQGITSVDSSFIFNFDENQNLTVSILYEKYNLDKSTIYFVVNGKEIHPDESLNNYDGKIIETRIRLKGGKGGFGSQLRTSQAVKKQTKNFDLCRDLQGKRLRITKQERLINEWKKKKEEEEKLLAKYSKSGDEDLFKKLMTEKKNEDIIKKNQKFFEDSQMLKNNIEKSLKYFINKKNMNKVNAMINKNKKRIRLRGLKNRGKKSIKEEKKVLDNEEEDEDEKELTEKYIEGEEINENRITKEEIDKIKAMDNEEDLLAAILG